MIVELTFLTGRFHATAWGRHVNEAVPEWPPSPFRLLRALVDAWYRKHEDIPADVVRRLLEKLSEPPVFLLPRARASHTRSYLAQNSEDPTDKKLIFDGFAVVDRDSRVLVGWPGVQLDPIAVEAARKLFGSLNYLGRSESWVRASVIEDRDVGWNCSPLEPGPVSDGLEVVSVAGVVPPAIFEGREFEVSARGRRAKARKLPWLEALTWGSAEALGLTMNRPPVLEPLFYVRHRDALNARPTPLMRVSTRQIEAVLFLTDGRVRVPITEAVTIGDAVRENLMGSLRKVLGHDALPPRFTGKDSEGRPVQDHSHISILSLDKNRDGFIDAILVTSPLALTVEEQRAFDQVYPVRRRNGHPLVLTPVRYGTREQLASRTAVVVSQTPFAPTLHWRLTRDADLDVWLGMQVALECKRRHLPEPIRVQRLPALETTHRKARWLDFRRARKQDSPQPAYGLRVTFAEPVLAPFSLGYASHFGLGCFVGD